MARSAQQLFYNYEAGEDLARGELVYLSGDTTVKKALADASATMHAMGIVDEPVLSGGVASVLIQGVFENFAHGFLTDSILYVSDAAAGTFVSASPAPPNVAQPLAHIQDANTLIFSPAGVFVDENLEAINRVDTVRFENLGSLEPIGNTIGGSWVPARSGRILAVTMHRKGAGVAGSTTVDVNKNGVTVFTTQANRPTILATSGNEAVVQSGALDINTFAALDYVQVQLDAKEQGNPKDLSITMEFIYD